MDASKVDPEIESLVAECTVRDLRANFRWLLVEMRAAARQFRPDERTLLRTVMTHTGPPQTVAALFPGFDREGGAHATLRRLRAGKFVRPGRTGRWLPDEPVEVTPFARVVWDRLGEVGVFPPAAPAAPTASKAPAPAVAKVPLPADTRTPMPNPGPVTWDNLLDRIRERQQNSAAG